MRNLVVAVGMLFTLLACSGPAEPGPGGGGVHVELDAFSGRPDPGWTLSAAEAAELAYRLEALVPAAGASLPEPGLGYRGFRIRNPDRVPGIPLEAYVSRAGLVLLGSAEQPDSVYTDTRAAEAWLVGIARKRGFEEVFLR